MERISEQGTALAVTTEARCEETLNYMERISELGTALAETSN
jgi:hypothetical protein